MAPDVKMISFESRLQAMKASSKVKIVISEENNTKKIQYFVVVVFSTLYVVLSFKLDSDLMFQFNSIQFS